MTIPRGDWGHPEKIDSVLYSLLSRFCFWQGQVDWWPRERFLFPTSVRGAAPTGRQRHLPKATKCPVQKSCGTTPSTPCGNCPCPFPRGLMFMHVYHWVPRPTFVHVESYDVVFHRGKLGKFWNTRTTCPGPGCLCIAPTHVGSRLEMSARHPAQCTMSLVLSCKRS